MGNDASEIDNQNNINNYNNSNKNINPNDQLDNKNNKLGSNNVNINKGYQNLNKKQISIRHFPVSNNKNLDGNSNNYPNNSFNKKTYNNKSQKQVYNHNIPNAPFKNICGMNEDKEILLNKKKTEIDLRTTYTYPRGNYTAESTKLFSNNEKYMFYFSKNNNIPGIRYLIFNKISINILDEERTSPLHVACRDGDVQTVEEIICQGAMINIPDLVGWTPLHIACFSNKPDIVLVLLKNGANFKSRNRDKLTPKEIAEKCGNKNCIKVIENFCKYQQIEKENCVRELRQMEEDKKYETYLSNFDNCNYINPNINNHIRTVDYSNNNINNNNNIKYHNNEISNEMIDNKCTNFQQQQELLYKQILKKYITYQKLKGEYMQNNEIISNFNDFENLENRSDLSNYMEDDLINGSNNKYCVTNINNNNNIGSNNIEIQEIEKCLNILNDKISHRKNKSNLCFSDYKDNNCLNKSNNKVNRLSKFLKDYKSIPKKHKFYLKYSYINGNFVEKKNTNIENSINFLNSRQFLLGSFNSNFNNGIINDIDNKGLKINIPKTHNFPKVNLSQVKNDVVKNSENLIHFPSFMPLMTSIEELNNKNIKNENDKNNIQKQKEIYRVYDLGDEEQSSFNSFEESLLYTKKNLTPKKNAIKENISIQISSDNENKEEKEGKKENDKDIDKDINKSNNKNINKDNNPMNNIDFKMTINNELDNEEVIFDNDEICEYDDEGFTITDNKGEIKSSKPKDEVSDIDEDDEEFDNSTIVNDESLFFNLKFVLNKHYNNFDKIILNKKIEIISKEKTNIINDIRNSYISNNDIYENLLKICFFLDNNFGLKLFISLSNIDNSIFELFQYLQLNIFSKKLRIMIINSLYNNNDEQLQTFGIFLESISFNKINILTLLKIIFNVFNFHLEDLEFIDSIAKMAARIFYKNYIYKLGTINNVNNNGFNNDKNFEDFQSQNSVYFLLFSYIITYTTLHSNNNININFNNNQIRKNICDFLLMINHLNEGENYNKILIRKLINELRHSNYINNNDININNSNDEINYETLIRNSFTIHLINEEKDNYVEYGCYFYNKIFILLNNDGEIDYIVNCGGNKKIDCYFSKDLKKICLINYRSNNKFNDIYVIKNGDNNQLIFKVMKSFEIIFEDEDIAEKIYKSFKK